MPDEESFYSCSKCEVEGRGMLCWNCGEPVVLVKNVWPFGGNAYSGAYHHHDPNRPDVVVEDVATLGVTL